VAAVITSSSSVSQTCTLNSMGTAILISQLSRGISSGTNVPAPDNFYDERTESEKEFEDIASSIILNGGVEKLTVIKEKVSLKDLSQPLSSRIASSNSNSNTSVPRYLQYLQTKDSAKHSSSGSFDLGSSGKSRGGSNQGGKGHNNNSNQQHNSSVSSSALSGDDISPMFDDVNNASGDSDKDANPLQNFLSDKDSNKFGASNQGLRHCPGQRQRRGLTGRLYCHKIDLDALDKLDVVNLRRFLTDDGEILGKKSTGLCSKCQRKVALSIKQARHLDILPHLGQFVIFDSKTDDMMFNSSKSGGGSSK